MNKRSFTLIEILVAMSILVVVITSTIAIFRTSATSWQRGEIRAQRYQMARFILQQMTREITSIIPTSVSGPYCVGSAKQFYFISSLAAAPRALAEVGYWLDESEQYLMRRYDDSPDYDFSSFDEEESLSENISDLAFQYSTGSAWQETWDSRSGFAQAGLLPKAVKISFTIVDERGDHEESFSTVVTIPAAEE